MSLRWENFENGYIEELKGDYHQNRTRFVLSLYPQFQNRVVDFGGGRVFFLDF